MDRPRIGTNPVVSNRDDEQYLDFVTGLFSFLPTIQPVISKRTEEEIEAFRQRTGRDPQDVHEAREVLDRIPIMATRHRIRRDIQEMKYYTVEREILGREQELLAELDRADTMGPGSVHYDPDFKVPDYACRDIHLLKGGYVSHPLAGYMYHYGTKVFFAGQNDEDEMHQRMIDKLPLPADNQVRRILDIGCSAGQSATALKKRFPEAEVWGIDAGIPMVRYAHKRAIDMGIEVHFAQRMAEDTGFPDGHFDIVHAFILFHELPPDAADAVIREAHRVLRPGGLFLVTDFGTADSARGDGKGGGILGEVYRDVDMRDNCEPYSWDFTHGNFAEWLGRYFAKVEVRTEGGLPLRIATR